MNQQVDSKQVNPPSPPGSPKAIRQGCICPAKVNNDGKGYHPGVDDTFVVNIYCPLHGG